ncbi:MAG: fructoselysine 3-epimerase [candidate division TA06 bacterium ADurb.Bin417]|uniref:Fructoselysine 3-epimerase n=1 Tax=candidate division TA06 bacterium ADurb.Bin417 TaxID=1852828 RepID=A0A1V5MC22_UNCT6|nr:MAG: fructoselysine 3-epimerase [candidate division TA06 bacterium ADurb.Bin417]
MIELAPALKTDTLLVVPGMVDEQTPNEIAWQRSQESIKSLLPAAAKAGVVLGIENVWNKMLLTPLEMKWYIDEFRHPAVQAYFDVGNMLVSGYPQHWIRILGSRVKRVHLKDFKLSVGNIEGFCDLLEGDVDYPEVMRALRDIGYDGYLTVEVFPRRHHPESLVHASGRALDFILGT